MKDIIICGHSPCDVIRNLLALDDRGDAETPDLANALRHAQRTRQVTAEHYRRLEGEPLLTAAIEENVLVQLENLRTLPAVASRLNRGDLHLQGWVYEPGAIFAYDPHQEQFVPLLQ